MPPLMGQSMHCSVEHYGRYGFDFDNGNELICEKHDRNTARGSRLFLSALRRLNSLMRSFSRKNFGDKQKASVFCNTPASPSHRLGGAYFHSTLTTS